MSKKIIDLKFTKTGVKLFIIQYCSNRYVCKKCKGIFIPSEYPTERLKVGHNLIAWAIYQHIVNKQGFRVIENNFKELFHLSISQNTFFACKDYFVRYYTDTYTELVNLIIKSQVLYVDETPFAMQFEKGFVWIFTNGEEVMSIYKPTREAGFLKEFLEEFKGVLVSDFYNGYDALDCRQQKCLIHLIRDFNSDLIKNPFNEEFKIMARDFTLLLQKIVLTIDKYGLKRYHLHKHKKEVDCFLKKVSASTYRTEITQQYQNRIERNREKLFEFLDHDNVSWNNSNAEHAIKILALHANKNLNSFRESHIDEYLKIMSIYQTCEYKDVSFLKFLLSKERSLNRFIDWTGFK